MLILVDSRHAALERMLTGYVLQARQHGRQPVPPSSSQHSPVHPAPTGVRAYSCQHWESRLAPPPRNLSSLEPHSPCDVVEVLPDLLCLRVDVLVLA
ncbi:jg13212 [Pararge aegeria aegeria]|uniref:Jg13212 protein n=1 Tax=Pararge aegeria aegeria TaxID=348720 RepID=A0A8S4REW4_9NEOP|nr:jg13212 [Pararge aegeria aegeria]